MSAKSTDIFADIYRKDEINDWECNFNDSNAKLFLHKWSEPIGWSQNSEYIYAARNDTIFLIHYDTGKIRSNFKLPENYFVQSITKDENTFISSVIENKHSDIWRIENFDQDFK